MVTKNKQLLSILTCSFIALLIWHKLFTLTFLGEGAIYFSDPYFSWVYKANLFSLFRRYDAFPLIFFGTAGRLIKANMFVYNLFIYASLVLIAFFIWKIIYKLTDSYFPAIVSSVLFLSSFAGLFGMVGLGYYQWFIQRVPNFIPMIASFYFLLVYFKSEKVSNYYASIFLYTLAMFMAHYSVLMSPLIIMFPLFLNLGERRIRLQDFISMIKIIFPFIVVTLFFLYKQEPYNATNTLSVETLFDLEFIKALSVKLVLLSIPGKVFVSFWGPEASNRINSFVVPIILVYLTTAIYTYNKGSRLIRAALLSVLSGLVFSIAFSLLLNSSFFTHSYDSRYLFVPAIFFSIFWGLAIYTFTLKSEIKIWMIFYIVLIWSFVNTIIIYNHFEDRSQIHEMAGSTLNHIRRTHDSYTNNSLIIVTPYLGGYGVQMLNQLYSNGDTIIYSDVLDELFNSAANAYYFDYTFGNTKLVRYKK